MNCKPRMNESETFTRARIDQIYITRAGTPTRTQHFYSLQPDRSSVHKCIHLLSIDVIRFHVENDLQWLSTSPTRFVNLTGVTTTTKSTLETRSKQNRDWFLVCSI